MSDAPLPSPPPEREDARIVFWLCALVSLGAAYIAYGGLINYWDRIGVPVMSALYGVAALCLWRFPARVNTIIFTALLPTSFYMQGCVYVAAQDNTVIGLFKLASGT